MSVNSKVTVPAGRCPEGMLDSTLKRPALKGGGISEMTLVEARGFEPLTLCLQSRCSPN